MALEYVRAGPSEGPPILFAHSLGSNYRQFLPQAARLSKRFGVICVSLRGHGASRAPSPETPATYSLHTVADDVARLLEYLEVPRVHYVGNSWGGLVGYQLLRDHPGLLCSLTTNGSPPAINLPRWLLAGVAAFNRVVNGAGGPRFTAWLLAHEGCRTPHAKAYAEQIFRANARSRAVYCVQASVLPFDFTPDLAASPCPVLLLRNELDFGFNRLFAAALQGKLAESCVETAELAGAGHLGNLDQPEAFTRELEAFLARRAPPLGMTRRAASAQ